MAGAELTEKDVREIRTRLEKIRMAGAGTRVNEQVRLIGCLIRKGERKAEKDVPKPKARINAEVIDAAELFDDDEVLRLF